MVRLLPIFLSLELASSGAPDNAHLHLFGQNLFADYGKASNHPVVRSLTTAACQHLSRVTNINCSNIQPAQILVNGSRMLKELAESSDVHKLIDHVPVSENEKKDIKRLFKSNTFEDAAKGFEKLVPKDLKSAAIKMIKGEGANDFLNQVVNYGKRVLSHAGFQNDICGATQGNARRRLKDIVNKHTSSDGSFVDSNTGVNRHLRTYCARGLHGLNFAQIGEEAKRQAKKAFAEDADAHRKLCAQKDQILSRVKSAAATGVLKDFTRNHGNKVANFICS